MLFKFVDHAPGGALLARMIKGGLSVSEAGPDEVFVSVTEGEEWADEADWIRTIEGHYACVFDDAPQ